VIVRFIVIFVYYCHYYRTEASSVIVSVAAAAAAEGTVGVISIINRVMDRQQVAVHPIFGGNNYYVHESRRQTVFLLMCHV